MTNIIYLLIGFVLFVLGGVFSFISFEVFLNPNTSWQSFSIFEKTHTFSGIFLNNLTVGFLISFGGYFSGGFLAAVILFYNGYLLIEIIQTAITLNVSNKEILYGLIFHGPIEILALLLFGVIGLQGCKFYFRILKKNTISISELNNKQNFFLPIILLFISGLIEVNL